METLARKSKKASLSKSLKTGTLIIVGGAEDKSKDKAILRKIAERAGHGKLVVATVASQLPDEMWGEYKGIFRNLGVKHLEHLHVRQPEDARNEDLAHIFKDANTIFFTGGDQLKITTKLGGTKVVDWIHEIYNRGGTIAGTSAGASVMGKTMLIGGENAESHKVGNWMMAPGLGLAEEMIIDQHFAQRGRIGRLLGAVALNPGVLGIGIDEDTSIIVEGDHFSVLGTNAVYVIDGREVTYTNISEATADRTMSMHDVRLHILAEGEVFDFKRRKVKAVAFN